MTTNTKPRLEDEFEVQPQEIIRPVARQADRQERDITR